ncbi:PIN domain-containing protein [Bradyrhizobium sp. UFLA05-112]
MSDQDSKYCLLLDANVWVSERMLHSSVGSAVLFAVAANSSTIVLPEIVELEVDRVLKSEAVRASAALRKSVDLLRQLSGHERVLQPMPTENAIHEGILRRWKELDGVIVRAPFTFEQAQASLQRILNHTPPCGENNEQFRDCCIWETALEFSASSVVHFVTNDSAFYDNRDRENIVKPLKNELALQLFFGFEVSALRGRLVNSAPARPSDDVCGLNTLSSESDGNAANFLD